MKPVAYMSKNGILFKELPPEPMDLEPLYTHPADLTDEEIEGIARANVDGHSSMEQLKWFARAILRKAQGK